MDPKAKDTSAVLTIKAYADSLAEQIVGIQTLDSAELQTVSNEVSKFFGIVEAVNIAQLDTAEFEQINKAVSHLHSAVKQAGKQNKTMDAGATVVAVPQKSVSREAFMTSVRSVKNDWQRLKDAVSDSRLFRRGSESTQSFKAKIVTFGVSEEVTEFSKEVFAELYAHLPSQYRKKFDNSIKAIKLGAMPPYMAEMGGAYDRKEKAVYISPEFVTGRNPQEICEIILHESGHALLDDEKSFKNLGTQTAADFLVYHALGTSTQFERSKDAYEAHKRELAEKLGENTTLKRDLENRMGQAKKEWYPRMREEVEQVLGAPLPEKLAFGNDDAKVLRTLYPKMDELLTDYEKDENPYAKKNMYLAAKQMAYVINEPIREIAPLGGNPRRIFYYLPMEFVENFKRYSGVELDNGFRSSSPERPAGELPGKSIKQILQEVSAG